MKNTCYLMSLMWRLMQAKDLLVAPDAARDLEPMRVPYCS